MSFNIRILCFDQDDPKKCTAKRLERFNLSDNHSNFKTLPPMGLVLDPFSEKILNSHLLLSLLLDFSISDNCFEMDLNSRVKFD